MTVNAVSFDHAVTVRSRGSFQVGTHSRLGSVNIYCIDVSVPEAGRRRRRLCHLPAAMERSGAYLSTAVLSQLVLMTLPLSHRRHVCVREQGIA